MLRTFALLPLLSVLCFPAWAQDTGNEYPLMNGCQWKDASLAVHGKANQKLIFRYQDCDGTYAAKASFALSTTDALVQTLADGVSDTVAQFWPLNGRKPSALVAEVASPSVADKDKGRCVVHLNYENGQYSYEPDAAYLEDLLALEEPFSACGNYGATNDAIQYFAVIDKAVLAFFWVGQDTPLFDPTSFHYDNSEKPGVVE